MLCAISRRAPAARAAATRFAVPSMRNRAFRTSASPRPAGSRTCGRSVSWWMTTSGRAPTTAARTAAASKASTTTGSTPRALSAAALSAERVVPVTWCPATRRNSVSRRPIAPLAPARKIRMAIIFSVIGDDELTTGRGRKGPRLVAARQVEFHHGWVVVTAQIRMPAAGRETKAHRSFTGRKRRDGPKAVDCVNGGMVFLMERHDDITIVRRYAHTPHLYFCWVRAADWNGLHHCVIARVDDVELGRRLGADIEPGAIRRNGEPFGGMRHLDPIDDGAVRN